MVKIKRMIEARILLQNWGLFKRAKEIADLWKGIWEPLNNELLKGSEHGKGFPKSLFSSKIVFF